MRLPGVNRARPEEVGLDSGHLRNHTVANEKYIKKGFMPGVAECVVCDNRLVYTALQGFQDEEVGVPMSDRSLHRCFSLTKPITSFGLMVLAEEGKLRFSDPVCKYIPSFKQMLVLKDMSAILPGPRGGGVEPARQPITLRHLITHTSGLGYGPGRTDREECLDPSSGVESMYMQLVQDLDDGMIADLEGFCDRLAELPLIFQPGTRYQYSMGMDVLGRVIEVVSGMRLDDFFRRHVFSPLGMRDTSFAVRPSVARRRLTAFYQVEALSRNRTSQKPETFKYKRRDGQMPEASAWVCGRSIPVLSGGGIMGSFAGGLVSSLRDQALFCCAIANTGFSHATGRQVLKPQTVNHMCKDWLKLKSVTQKRRLLGWSDNPGYKRMGWCPLGFCEGDVLFMGGVGSWSIERSTKTICISMSNAWCEESDVHGWVGDVDELEGAVKTARSLFLQSAEVEALPKAHRRSRSSDEDLCPVKRARKT